MQISMLTLAGLCAIIGIGAPSAARLVFPAIEQLAPFTSGSGAMNDMSRLLGWVGICSALLTAMIAIFVWLRGRLLLKRRRRETVTWDCGYAAPSARMQYTASSFADPVVSMFGTVLRTQKDVHAAEGYFPQHAAFHSHTEDIFVRFIYLPGLDAIKRVAGAFRTLQRGRTHLYILYIFATIMALLAWNLR